MDHKVTIKEVAELAGVSKSTVSRYLNRGYVSEEKRELVRAAIAQTGFKSNFFAKRLKTKESKLIGIVLPRMDSVTVGKLLMGINRVLDPAGYQVLVQVSQLSQRRELEAMRSLQQQGVDGIIVDSVGITDEHALLARELTLPVVFTGQEYGGLTCIKVDDYGAGHLMGAFLRQMGHTHAVFAGVSETDKAVGRERKQGFLDGFGVKEAHNLTDEAVPVPSHPVTTPQVDFVETGFDFLSAYDKTALMWAQQPSVIVGATDNISLGILRYLHERGLHVPEDVSVTGFGGYEVGAVVYPALTTVAFDFELIGMKAAQAVLDMLHDEAVCLGGPEPMHLIQRESVRELGKLFVPEQSTGITL